MGVTRNCVDTSSFGVWIIPYLHILSIANLLTETRSWNSAIFSSIPLVVVNRAVVTIDFSTFNDDWLITRPHQAQQINPLGGYVLNDIHAAASSFTRLDNADCMAAFIDPLQTTQDLIVVTRRAAADNNGSSLMWADFPNGGEGWDGSSLWICSEYEPEGYSKACPLQFALTFADNWLNSAQWNFINGTKEVWWLPDLTAENLEPGWWQNVTIDHCLVGQSGDNQQRCGLHYSSSLLVFVSVCTTTEFLLMVFLVLQYYRSTHKPREDKFHGDNLAKADKSGVTLVLLGDAIAAALRETDGSHTRIRPHTEESVQRAYTAAKLDVLRWDASRSPMWFTAVGPKTWLISTPL